MIKIETFIYRFIARDGKDCCRLIISRYGDFLNYYCSILFFKRSPTEVIPILYPLSIESDIKKVMKSADAWVKNNLFNEYNVVKIK